MSSVGATDELVFFVNGKKIVEKNADPEIMLLPYLRKRLRLTGTKLGCGVGGCGACTVMISIFDPVSKKIRHYSATACLLPICCLHGAAITTVEGVGSTKTRLHPVQERIAKAHGSQCGFCTPGMVMSMYTLLRNHPEPTMEQIFEALGGNLCRCTGYRPIIDGCKTFSSSCCKKKDETGCCLDPVGGACPATDAAGDDKVCKKLQIEDGFLPFDPTQEFIFPPELTMMVRDQKKKKLVFQGERITWISPATLMELLELKAKYPKAPLVVGNTSVGLQMKLNRAFYPVLISPAGIPDLSVVSFTEQGLTLGAACNLTMMKDILIKAISDKPHEKTKIFQALLQQLKTLAGEQIRNVASLGGHIVSRSSASDLNPILAVGNCTLNLSSKAGNRQIPLDEAFFASTSPLKPEEILVSVVIPYSKKGAHVSAFRQAMLSESSAAFVNAGMRVLFKPGTDTIADFNIYYGGMGPATVSAKKTCQKLIGRQWNEEMLNEACRSVLGEVSLPGSAPGGMVEYRRTLTVSFLFKFYLEVLQELKKMNVPSSQDIPATYLSALEPFKDNMPQSVEVYQEVPPTQPPQDPVGRPLMHMSAIKQATGEAVYVDDMPVMDREFHMVFVTSARAHAKILNIEVSEAMKLTGVVDVITAKDVPGSNLVAEGDYLFATDEVGFMNDGRIMAVDVSHYSNAGCTPDESILVIVVALVKMDNGYMIPNLRVVGRTCKTNLPSNTGFRGFGFPQSGMVTESWVDAVALKCGLPPEKVREINMHKGTSSETHYKQRFDATNLTRCWTECMEKSSYPSRRAAIEEFNKKNYWKKKGIAIIPLKFSVGFIIGAFHQAAALVHIFLDGSVLVTHGGVEMGQGVHTKVSQIASRVLNIPISKVYICETCTTTIPNSCPSGGSIGTDIYGLAVKTACETLMKRLEPIISNNPGGKWEEWIGAAFMAKVNLSATGFFNGYDTDMDWDKGEGYATPYYVFGAACSEVEIDCLTGAHKNIRTDIVMDIGVSINPGVDVGQIEGAFVQGLGLYTIEELKYSPEGSLYTRGPDQYKIPTVNDIPEQFFVYLLASSENPYTIYSSKGVGEPALFLGCSVYFAIKDAIAAARKERKLPEAFPVRTPLSPERIRMACLDNMTDMIPKDAPGSYTPWAINV